MQPLTTNNASYIKFCDEKGCVSIDIPEKYETISPRHLSKH